MGGVGWGRLCGFVELAHQHNNGTDVERTDAHRGGSSSSCVRESVAQHAQVQQLFRPRAADGGCAPSFSSFYFGRDGQEARRDRRGAPTNGHSARRRIVGLAFNQGLDVRQRCQTRCLVLVVSFA